jgi:amino acid transporter
MLAALIAIVTDLSYAELSSIFPKSAAAYVYTKNAFDGNFIGSDNEEFTSMLVDVTKTYPNKINCCRYQR